MTNLGPHADSRSGDVPVSGRAGIGFGEEAFVSPPREQIGVGGLRISGRAKQLVMEVLESNRLSSGPMMQRFEREIAALHGCKLGLMCNSGTSALQIALAALKEKNGWDDEDEVLVPALTFMATSNVVLFNGLRPVFVDVEPEYYCIDPSKIEARITDRTRAIVPVHVGGLPADMDPILELARAHDLRIVEDSAEAMGVRYKGRPVGSFGDVACFSTYIAHLISTGVGGLCTTDDAELMEIMRSLMNHGRDSIYVTIDDDQVGRERISEIVHKRFSFVRLGHSFRATEMEAALGVAQFEEREELWACRTKIAERLTKGLSRHRDRLQLPRARPNAEHAFMFYPLVVVDPSTSRDDLVEYLEARNIETRPLLPLINQPVYRRLFGNLDREYPVAGRLNANAFYIGCHPAMSANDVQYVLTTFDQYFSARG
jgi:perosamine synthetase